MDEDEIESKTEVVTAAAPVNYADLVQVAILPVKFALMGAVNGLDYLTGLMQLHSNHLDEKKRTKQMRKDLEKIIG